MGLKMGLARQLLNQHPISLFGLCWLIGSVFGVVYPLQAQIPNATLEVSAKSTASVMPLEKTLTPVTPEVLFSEGVTQGEAGNYARSVALFSEVIAASPLSPEAYYNRGLSLERLGESEKAITDYNQTLRLDGEYIAAYVNRGNLYSQQGNHEQAIQDFSRAMTIDPSRYKAYYNRANSYFQLGEYKQAIADYETVLILKPDYIEAVYNRGLTYYQLGNLDKARQDLFQAAQSYLNRGDRANYLEALERITDLELSANGGKI